MCTHTWPIKLLILIKSPRHFSPRHKHGFFTGLGILFYYKSLENSPVLFQYKTNINISAIRHQAWLKWVWFQKIYNKWFNKCLSMSATSLYVSYKCAVFERKLWFCFSDCRWSLNDTSFIQFSRCLYLGSAVASYGTWCPTPWQSCQYWLQRCMFHWGESPHGLHNLKEKKKRKKKTFNKWGLWSSF